MQSRGLCIPGWRPTWCQWLSSWIRWGVSWFQSSGYKMHLGDATKAQPSQFLSMSAASGGSWCIIDDWCDHLINGCWENSTYTVFWATWIASCLFKLLPSLAMPPSLCHLHPGVAACPCIRNLQVPAEIVLPAWCMLDSEGAQWVPGKPGLLDLLSHSWCLHCWLVVCPAIRSSSSWQQLFCCCVFIPTYPSASVKKHQLLQTQSCFPVEQGLPTCWVLLVEHSMG